MSACHCLECQRRTGSTHGVAAFFVKGNVKITGDYNRYTRDADNGFKVVFYFCPTCGSTVYWEPERKPDVIVVAVGAFADPQFQAPSQSVFEEHKHQWVHISTKYID